MGKILIGGDALSKVYVGSSEVSKMILNGATVYEKQAPAPTGFSGTVTNTGYIYGNIYVDRPYDSSDPDYSIVSSEQATFSCAYFYIVQGYDEFQVYTATNCTYERVSDDPAYGYKVIPTADNWVFTVEFTD